MTTEKRETAIKWLQEEIRSLRLAPKINGCGPENWADLLEIMETCLEAVKGNKKDPLTVDQLKNMVGEWVQIFILDISENIESMAYIGSDGLYTYFGCDNNRFTIKAKYDFEEFMKEFIAYTL